MRNENYMTDRVIVMELNNGDSQIITLQEVQEYCFKNKDLKTCKDLLNKGHATIGSITFRLIGEII